MSGILCCAVIAWNSWHCAFISLFPRVPVRNRPPIVMQDKATRCVNRETRGQRLLMCIHRTCIPGYPSSALLQLSEKMSSDLDDIFDILYTARRDSWANDKSHVVLAYLTALGNLFHYLDDLGKTRYTSKGLDGIETALRSFRNVFGKLPMP